MSHCDLSVSSQMHSSKWNLNLTITTQKVIQVNSRLILNSYRPPLIKTVKAVSLLDIGTVPEVSQSSDNHLWSLTWFVFIRPRQHQGSVPLLWGFLWRCVESDSCLKCWKGQLLPWRFTCDLTYLSQTVTSSGDSWYITPEAWQHWWQTQLSANTKLSAPVTYFNLLDQVWRAVLIMRLLSKLTLAALHEGWDIWVSLPPALHPSKGTLRWLTPAC